MFLSNEIKDIIFRDCIKPLLINSETGESTSDGTEWEVMNEIENRIEDEVRENIRKIANQITNYWYNELHGKIAQIHQKQKLTDYIIKKINYENKI